MTKYSFQKAADFLTKNQRHRTWLKIVGALACVVVFCTVYALILPAVTMEKPSTCKIPAHTHTDACYTRVESEPVLDCTYDTLGVHTHTDECYDNDDETVCGFADFVVHQHDGSCYNKEGNLVCTLPEILPHTHTDECYAVVELDGGMDEMNPGIGGTDKPEPDPEPTPDPGDIVIGLEPVNPGPDNLEGAIGLDVIGNDDITEADLDEDKLEEETEPETKPETEETEESDGDETEPKTQRKLVCEKEEIIVHEHDDSCYDGKILVCLKREVREHVHSDDCFHEAAPAESETPTCGLEEGEGAHRHDETCYDENGNLLCLREESDGHIHTERCYGEWTLTCGMEEHIHTDECYSNINGMGPNEIPVSTNATGDSSFIQNYEVQIKRGDHWEDLSDGAEISVNDTVRIAFDYSIPEGTLNSEDKTLSWQLPEGIKPQSEITDVLNVTGSTEETIGTYRISTDGILTFEFNEDYVEKNQNQKIVGGFQYQMEVKDLNIGDDDKVELGFSNPIHIHIKDRYSETGDLQVEKSHIDNVDLTNGTVTFKIKVWSENGTGSTVELSDTLGESFESLDLSSADFKLTDAKENTSAITPTVTGNTFKATLPQLGIGEEYYVTYIAKIKDFDTFNKITTARNDVKVTSTNTAGGQLTASDDDTVEVSRKVVAKTGTLNKDTGKIEWTITVNESGIDIGGWELADIYGPTNGDLPDGTVITINPPTSDATNGIITLPYTFPSGSKDTYTITYETEPPAQSGNEQVVVNNTATLTPPGDGKPSIPGASTPVHVGEFNPMDKIGVSVGPMMETSDGRNVVDLNWKTTIKGPLTAGGTNINSKYGVTPTENCWVYEDTVDKRNYGETEPSHYITGTQIQDIITKLDAVAGLNYDLYAYEWVKQSDQFTGIKHNKTNINADDIYSEFIILFYNDLPADSSIEFAYATTLDVGDGKSNIEWVQNTANVEGDEENPQQNYIPTIKKGDPSAPEWNGAWLNTTQHEYADTYKSQSKVYGVLKWKIIANLPKDPKGDIVIKEQLPKGMKLFKPLDYPNATGDGSSFKLTIAWDPTGDVSFSSADSDSKEFGGNLASWHVMATKINDREYTITIPADVIKEKWNEHNPTATLEVQAIIDEDVAAKLDENYTDFTNRVSVWENGVEYGNTKHTQQVRRPAVKKLASVAADVINYSLDINPMGKTYGTNDGLLTLTDILSYQKNDFGSGMTLSLDSLHVYKVDTNGDFELDADGKKIDIFKDCVFTIEERLEGNDILKIFHMKLPDSTPLKVEYSYSFYTKDGTELQLTNSATLEGTTVLSDKDESSNTVSIETSSGHGHAEGITLYKVNENNYSITLPNARFKLYSTQTPEDEESFEELQDYITEDDGKVVLTGLKTNTAYKLVETVAPDGYIKSETPYYFYLEGSTMTFPNGYKLRTADGNIYFKNTPEPETPTGKVTPTKTIDAFRDNVSNPDTSLDDDNTTDKYDLYRLYLNAQVPKETPPTDLLIVIDQSGSMHMDYDTDQKKYKDMTDENGNNIFRDKAVSLILNGSSTIGLSETYNEITDADKTAYAACKENSLIYNFLNLNPDNRVAVVGFYGSEANTTDSSVIVDWTSESQPVYVRGQKLNGTNYCAGLQEADELLYKVETPEHNGHRKIMLFLSDGVPTLYLENGERKGNGGGDANVDKDNIKNSAAGTEPFIKTLMQHHSNVTVHTIGVSKSIIGQTQILQFMSEQGNGNHYNAISTNELRSALEAVSYATDSKNLVIQDTLSDYVALHDTKPDFKVTKTNLRGEETVLYVNGKSTSMGEYAIVSVKSENVDGKTVVTATFNPNYKLEAGATYTLSFNVKTTDKAYQEYKTEGKYPQVGDTGTDYDTNQTSSGKDGFRSNTNATMTYTKGDETITEHYDHPVVQVREDLIVEKKWQDANNNPIDAPADEIQFKVIGKAKKKVPKPSEQVTINLQYQRVTNNWDESTNTTIENYPNGTRIVNKGDEVTVTFKPHKNYSNNYDAISELIVGSTIVDLSLSNNVEITDNTYTYTFTIYDDTTIIVMGNKQPSSYIASATNEYCPSFTWKDVTDCDVEKTFTLRKSASGEWRMKLDWDKLPRKEGRDDLIYTYSIEEVTPANYTVSYSTENGTIPEDGGTVTITNTPGVTPPPPTPTDGLEHHKRIDAFRDGTDNPDTDLDDNSSDVDKTDLYRLYLDAVVPLDKAPATDLLLVVDQSGSMHLHDYESVYGDKLECMDMQDDKGKTIYRDQAVRLVLNGTYGPEYGEEYDDPGVKEKGLVWQFLNENPANNIAVVNFQGERFDNKIGSTISYDKEQNRDAGLLSKFESDDGWLKKGEERYIDVEGQWQMEDFGWLIEEYNVPHGTNYCAGILKAKTFLSDVPSPSGGNNRKIMLFLSDGYPTYYLDSNPDGQRYVRKGGDGLNMTADEINGSETYFDEFIKEHPDVTVYSIGFSRDITAESTTGQQSSQVLTYMAEKGKGEYKAANTTEALMSAILEIMHKTDYTNLEITDTLSPYVDFYNTQLDVKITKTVGDTVTVLFENGEITDEGEGILTTVDGHAGYKIEGNKITTLFDPNYNLEAGAKYTLSFNVKTTQKAYDEFAANGYTTDEDGNITTGDEDTDYGTNTTSSGQSGFHSNTDATLTYKKDGNPPTTEHYPNPVIQAVAYKIAVDKTNADKSEHLADAKFDLYRPLRANESTTDKPITLKDGTEVDVVKINKSAHYTSGTDGEGIFIIDNLGPGDYYLVEAQAPNGYKTLDYAIPFKIYRKSDTTGKIIAGLVQNEGGTDEFVTIKQTPEGGGETTETTLPGLTVPNESWGYKLPDTGGSGTLPYTIGGAILIAIPTAAMLYRKKRRKEGASS